METPVYNGLNFERKSVVGNEQVLSGGTISNIFTIVGGLILLEAVVGYISETVAAGVCNAKLVHNPTVGVDSDLCAVLDIQNDVLGGYWFMNGDVSTALGNAVKGTSLALPLGIHAATKLMVDTGGINFNLSASPAQGKVIWTMNYRPITPGAYVTAL